MIRTPKLPNAQLVMRRAIDKNVDDLKENVLKNIIELSGRYHIYNQVRTLFEEE